MEQILTQSRGSTRFISIALKASNGFTVAAGSGVRREIDGVNVLLTRIVVEQPSFGGRLSGNVAFERPLAGNRDVFDVITTVGWSRRVSPVLAIGVETLAEDLEGFWEASEARRQQSRTGFDRECPLHFSTRFARRHCDCGVDKHGRDCLRQFARLSCWSLVGERDVHSQSPHIPPSVLAVLATVPVDAMIDRIASPYSASFEGPTPATVPSSPRERGKAAAIANRVRSCRMMNGATARLVASARRQ